MFAWWLHQERPCGSVAALVAGSSDVATVVDEIVSVNHLSSSSVAAGTRLLVPLK
jgi:hypothetical protein